MACDDGILFVSTGPLHTTACHHYPHRRVALRYGQSACVFVLPSWIWLNSRTTRCASGSAPGPLSTSSPDNCHLGNHRHRPFPRDRTFSSSRWTSWHAYMLLHSWIHRLRHPPTPWRDGNAIPCSRVVQRVHYTILFSVVRVCTGLELLV